MAHHPTSTTPGDVTDSPAAAHYRAPDWFTRQVMNRAVRRLTRWGVSVRGSRELLVRGRTSGQWRSTPVNLLELDGERYLVAPRGETQWVRNLRAAGGGELRVGRRRQPFTGEELTGDEKAPILRAYLERWSWEVGQFFDGVGPDADDDTFLAILPKHPVFRITTT